MSRQLPTSEQLVLLTAVVRGQPDSARLLRSVALGEELASADLDRLEDAISAEFLDEVGADGEPSDRGRQLDELLGFVSQLGSGYYESMG